MTEDLRVEKLLMVHKDEQLQPTNQEINLARAMVVEAFLLTDEYNGVLFS